MSISFIFVDSITRSARLFSFLAVLGFCTLFPQIAPAQTKPAPPPPVAPAVATPSRVLAVAAPFYQRQTSWEETVRLSLEAMFAAKEKEMKAGEQVPKPTRVKWEAVQDGIWQQLQADFPRSIPVMDMEISDRIWDPGWHGIKGLAERYGNRCQAAGKGEAKTLAAKAVTPQDLNAVRELYRKELFGREWVTWLSGVNVEAARLAIDDMEKSFPGKYDGTKHRKVLEAFAVRREAIVAELRAGNMKSCAEAQSLYAGVRQALLANPVLDFDRILLIDRRFGAQARSIMSAPMGFPMNNAFTQNTIRQNGWDNSISVLSDLRGAGRLTPIYRPAKDNLISDIDLHFNGSKMMFTSVGTTNHWALFELNADGNGLKEITPTNLKGVDFYDSCYLPDGKIAVTTTAAFQGLPCVNGSSIMAQLYLMDGEGEPNQRKIRQLTFEQDSDWCPTVLNNGRLMYLRWEYTDQTHYFSRILFHCNPDGSDQREYYHSNSYFPNSFFYARPIPGHTSQVVGIAGGHHGISRSGRLLIIDPAKGRHEAEGVVQEIPGRGKKVEPIIKDQLVNGVWPQFLQPYPLSDPATNAGAGKYFLVACKPNPNALWGIYLVDIFDNMTLIKESPGSALLEPLPLRATPSPPVIPDRIDLTRKDALVFLSNIYQGGGLKDVPKGEVKSLRLFSYHFNHMGRGGHGSVGVESSWDVKRVLGTVPVEADGSAFFRIPANLPIAVQPLDKDGRSLQLMRSWFVGAPGENLSCIGCHEKQNAAVPNARTRAAMRAPSEITPWFGPARPFAFRFEVQPVLDRHCAGCHGPNTPLDLATSLRSSKGYDQKEYLKDVAYMNLQQYVRRPGPESDQHMMRPMEYHASTSDLMQLLDKGHYGVQLNQEDKERLATWIDLNAPYRGNWSPGAYAGLQQDKARLENARRFANVDIDPEAEFDALQKAADTQPRPTPVPPGKMAASPMGSPQLPGWPFDPAKAAQMQASGGPATQEVAISGSGGKMTIQLRRIPAGKFAMGSSKGLPDELPVSAVEIPKAFWMGEVEVSNELYRCFDPTHDSRYLDLPGKDIVGPGLAANEPNQPVIRVTWQQAMKFCQWLSEKTGKKFTLPTEAQWEWACRAGTDTEMNYGDVKTKFGPFANLAGTEKRVEQPYPGINDVSDGQAYAQKLGGYKPNAWGLKDMHGNVAEWTRSSYKPYPYVDGDGRNDLSPTEPKVARGGSWRHRPTWARSAIRFPFKSWQPVSYVGFRVVCEE